MFLYIRTSNHCKTSCHLFEADIHFAYMKNYCVNQTTNNNQCNIIKRKKHERSNC